MTPKDETVTQHLGGSTSDKDKPCAPAWEGYKELKSVEGKVVGYVCVECGRLHGMPHRDFCSRHPAQPKSAALLASFATYCHEHPEYRFWQALRNWADLPFLFAGTKPPHDGGGELYDTFSWEDNVNVRVLAKARGEA